MKAFKRWAALVVALTAVAALAAPSMASAFKLESSKGVLAKVGTELTLTGHWYLNTFLGPESCETTVSYDKLVRNESSGITFEAAANEGAPRQECNTGYGLLGHIRELKVSLQTFKNSQSALMSFTSESGNLSPIVCKWSGSIPFTYWPGGSNVEFKNGAGLTSTGGCGSATLSGTFALSIGSIPVILN